MQSSASTFRTLIFGGTFDPPHRAHVELPQAAARELRCDRILYVPAAINPLKIAPDLPPPTPAHHRLAMLRLALHDVPNVEISEIELKHSGPSYTIDTLRELSKPEAATMSESSLRAPRPPRLFLLIGADQALDFHRWKDWRRILELGTPAVMLRPPWTHETFESALRERYDAGEAGRWLDRTLRALPLIDVSATTIRERLRHDQPLDDLVSPAVEAYIREHHLYGIA